MILRLKMNEFVLQFVFMYQPKGRQEFKFRECKLVALSLKGALCLFF